MFLSTLKLQLSKLRCRKPDLKVKTAESPHLRQDSLTRGRVWRTISMRAPVAQRIEQLPSKQWVGGSNPSRGVVFSLEKLRPREFP